MRNTISTTLCAFFFVLSFAAAAAADPYTILPNGDLVFNVSVTTQGGCTWTASVLFGALGIPVQMTNFDQTTALEKLKQGELAAMVFVTGQPSRISSSGTGRTYPGCPA